MAFCTFDVRFACRNKVQPNNGARADRCISLNPYISTIRFALDQVEDDSIPAAVELKHLQASLRLQVAADRHYLGSVRTSDVHRQLLDRSHS